MIDHGNVGLVYLGSQMWYLSISDTIFSMTFYIGFSDHYCLHVCWLCLLLSFSSVQAAVEPIPSDVCLLRFQRIIWQTACVFLYKFVVELDFNLIFAIAAIYVNNVCKCCACQRCVSVCDNAVPCQSLWCCHIKMPYHITHNILPSPSISTLGQLTHSLRLTDCYKESQF